MIDYWCGCEPTIEFKDETTWREHMMSSKHNWSEAQVDTVIRKAEEID